MKTLQLLIIFVFFSLAQTNAQNPLVDSLLNITATSQNDTVLMRTYNQLRRATYYSDADASKAHTEKYLEHATAIQDSHNMILAHFFLGNANVIGGDYEAALQEYLIAANYYETKKDSARLTSVFNSLGAVYEKTKSDSLSLHYYVQARDMGKSLGDLRRSGIASVNIGNIYNNSGKLEQAIPYLEDAIKDLESNVAFISFLNLARINLAGAYGKTQEYSKALELYQETLVTLDTINDFYNHAGILRGIGNIFLQQNQPQRAKPYSEKAYAKYVDQNFTDEQFQMMPELISIYRSAGELNRALALYDEYDMIRDSLLQVENNRTITDAVQKYETDKKNQEIAQLGLMDELNQARISNQRNLIVGLVIGVGLLLFLLQRIFAQNRKIETQKKELEKALNDKNILLKEIHHRVKNNLQVVSSLLGLQSRYVQNDDALDAIKTGRTRVQSMSLLHQNVYKNENLKSVKIKKYFEDLGENLFANYHLNDQQIEFETNIEDLEFDIDVVVPLGLITNELMSNALKYAFPNQQNGKIILEIHQDDDQVVLEVSDNGIGIPFTELPERSTSLGMQLVKSFAEKLQANVQIFNDQGTRFRFKFDPKQVRVAA